MPEFLERVVEPMPAGGLEVLVRLIIAMLLGGVVMLIYRATRAADQAAPSFTMTLVLLSILIPMVTQVIGDNVARAFSLVGALSIVRFRTVVRDTQDTAYVIFAVAVGMAVGAGHPVLALSGIAVVAAAASLMRRGVVALHGRHETYMLKVNEGMGRGRGFPPDFMRGGPGGRGFGPFAGGPDLDPLIGLDNLSKPLRSKLLAVPTLRARYLAYVRDIAQRWLDWKVLEPRLREYQVLIAEDVKTDTRKLYSFDAFQTGLTGTEHSLHAFVEKRRQFLLNVTAAKAEMK